MAPRALLLAVVLASASPSRAALTCQASSLSKGYQAALDQFLSTNSCGQDAALKSLNAVFKDGVPKARAAELLFNGPTSDPQPYQKPAAKAGAAPAVMTPITADILDLAVAHVRARIVSGGIATTCTSDDESGAYDRGYDCAFSVCGTLETGQATIWRIKNGFAQIPQLRDGDQIALTMTHELVHVLVNYFRRVYGVKPADMDQSAVQKDYAYYTFFSGCGLYEASNFQVHKGTPIQYSIPAERYASSASDEQAARLISASMQGCFLKKPNPYFAAILDNPTDACAP